MARYKSQYKALSLSINGEIVRFEDGILATDDPAVIAALGPVADAVRDETMALYVWGTYGAIGTPELRAEFIQFLSANNLGKVYMFIDASLTDDVYRDFIRESGVTVYTLAGDSTWVLPENRSNIITTVRWAADFNAKYPEKFAGIQMDMEPYTLPEWGTAQDQVARQWTEAMDMFVNIAHILDRSLKTCAAVPFWCDTVFVYTYSIADYFAQRLDEIAVMSYRDNMPEFIAVTDTLLALGEKYNTKIVLGLESLDVQPANLTFFQEGRAALDAQVAAIFQTIKGASFGGVALHDYNGIRALKA